MNRIFFAMLLLFQLGSSQLMAQPTDTLWVKVVNNRWDIVHKKQPGETLFQISKLYHLPTSELARENGIGYNTSLADGTLIYIPLDIYNRISQPGIAGTRPLYYRAAGNDDWSRVAFLAQTSAATLREWNKMPMTALKNGQILVVGWVKYEDSDRKQPVPATPPPTNTFPAWDTLPPAATISTEEEQFNLLTENGLTANKEKGAAVYFDSKTPGARHYAFFNLAPRGAIIKVVNPGNGQYIFAKVIGTLPEQDRYQNALIGLSINAQKILGGKGSRTWCEVQY